MDPTSPDGTGGASYRLSRNGEERWTAKHPFRFVRACVSNEAVVVGFGYSTGIGGSPSGAPGEFLLAVLAPDGGVRKLHSTEREWSDFPHTLPNPLGIDVFLQEPFNRFVVRVEDEDVNRLSEAWWIFDLSTGALVSKVRPKEHQDRTQDLRSVIAAVPVRETPLVLVQWYQYESGRFGTRFALVDDRGHALWVLDLPDDYTKETWDKSYGWVREVLKQEHGAILRWDEARRFDLCLVEEWQRVTFEVAQSADGIWRTREVARRSNSADDGSKDSQRTEPRSR